MLYTSLIGLVVGAVAKVLMPGKDPGGIIITILLGIAGSWFANFLGLRLFAFGEAAAFVSSVVGAMLLLVLYRLLFGKTT